MVKTSSGLCQRHHVWLENSSDKWQSLHPFIHLPTHPSINPPIQHSYIPPLNSTNWHAGLLVLVVGKITSADKPRSWGLSGVEMSRPCNQSIVSSLPRYSENNFKECCAEQHGQTRQPAACFTVAKRGCRCPKRLEVLLTCDYRCHLPNLGVVEWCGGRVRLSDNKRR